MTLAVDHITVRSDARAYALGLVNNDSNDGIRSAEKKISRLAHRDAMRPKISQPRISAERQSPIDRIYHRGMIACEKSPIACIPKQRRKEKRA